MLWVVLSWTVFKFNLGFRPSRRGGKHWETFLCLSKLTTKSTTTMALSLHVVCKCTHMWEPFRSFIEPSKVTPHILWMDSRLTDRRCTTLAVYSFNISLCSVCRSCSSIPFIACFRAKLLKEARLCWAFFFLSFNCRLLSPKFIIVQILIACNPWRSPTCYNSCRLFLSLSGNALIVSGRYCVNLKLHL